MSKLTAGEKSALDAQRELTEIQADILNRYSKMTKVGGILVYSTCSIFPCEDHNQIAAFLEHNPDFELVAEKTVYPSQGGDGFYMAKLTRLDPGRALPEENPDADTKAEEPAVAEELPAEEEPVEEEPEIEEEPEAEEIAAVEEEQPAEEEPVAEEIPVTEEEPVAEEVPGIEEEPVAEEVPGIEEEPVAEEIPEIEEEPVAEEVPEIEEEPLAEEE